jgi:hypothetical protein
MNATLRIHPSIDGSQKIDIGHVAPRCLHISFSFST